MNEFTYLLGEAGSECGGQRQLWKSRVSYVLDLGTQLRNLGTEMPVQEAAVLVVSCRGTFQMEIPVPKSEFASPKDSIYFSIFTSAGTLINKLQSQRIHKDSI